jgi:hypothetical protein
VTSAAAGLRRTAMRLSPRRAQEIRCFAATRRGVLELADWLRCWQVPAVVTESTSGCWKPVFCQLAVCFERGSVASCFLAAPEFRLIRLHARLSQAIEGCWPRMRSSRSRPSPCPGGAAGPPRTSSPKPART